jgi:hypothetical protein
VAKSWRPAISPNIASHIASLNEFRARISSDLTGAWAWCLRQHRLKRQF